MNIREFKGIGKKTAALFNKINIHTTQELLEYFPRKYEEHPAPVKMADTLDGQKCVVVCQVTKMVKMNKKGTYYLAISDGTDQIICQWFHDPYLSKVIKKGTYYVFSGKITEYFGKKYMFHPELKNAEEYCHMIGSLTPVYPLTKGLSNNTVFKYVLQAISNLDETETLPEGIIKEYHLISRADAIRCIHYPANEEVLRMAKRRIIFEEFYQLLSAIKEKSENRGDNHYKITESRVMDQTISQLPYELTNSQKKAVNDIMKDFGSDKVSNRLIQGDVGSGKTLVALLSMIAMADHGYQSAFMAPTEVLAVQHYKELVKLLKVAGKMEKYSPVLLTGSLSAAEKEHAQKMLSSGDSRMVIGTHAVIQEKVEFDNLALAIIDEQHRFGVEQRESLSQKGKNSVHTIIMTATPIPRTTGNIVFGGMDITIMKDKPAGRSPVKNYHIMESDFNNLLELVNNELKKEHQVYVICPMVTGDEEGLKSVDSTAEEMKKLFPVYKVGKVHGKMDPKDKNTVMEQFSSGTIDILVATTVIEVGVNVPNATVMIIEGANNFGMLQLHQIRGRVGRGSDQSYCIFLDTSETPCKKLNILASTDDGFEIAEADYNMRLAGDILGTRQSGDMGFKLADIIRDETILKEAADAVHTKRCGD